VRDVDVIHNENWYGVGQVNRATFNYADSGGPGLIEDVHFENVAIEGRILRLFGFKAGGGQKIRDFHFNNLNVGSLGAGQLGSPGRNYFIGDITGFHFDGLTIGGENIRTPEAGWMEFASGAGEGFLFDGQASNTRFASSVPPRTQILLASPASMAPSAATPRANLLHNAKFAAGATSWTLANAPATLTDADGVKAASVPARQHIQQDVTAALRAKGPGTYTYGASVRAVSDDAAVKVTLRLEDESGAQLHPSPDVTATRAGWQNAARTQPLQWSNLKGATLLIESSDARPADFLVREVWLAKQPE